MAVKPLSDKDIVHITRLKEAGQEVSAVKLYQLRDWAGWGFYRDGTYTKDNPFIPPRREWVMIPTDQTGNTLKKQEPMGTPLFVDNKVTGREGDALIIGLRFKMSATRRNTWADIAIDIGTEDNPIRIAPQTVQFVKNRNDEQGFVLTYLVYTLDTWEKNGGAFMVYANRANTKFYDISVSVTRTHAARERLGAEPTNGIA